MMNDTNIWIECLSSLHRSQMRKAVSREGLQLVHLEVLQYLSNCNKYSNTAQALSEYLGQTKGSISQSLKFLEEKDYIDKKTDPVDKRCVRLYLTKEAKTCLRRMNKNLMPITPDNSNIADILRTVLRTWQSQNDSNGFGQCCSCKYNIQLTKEKFQCGLTGEPLKKSDTTKICKEHAFPHEEKENN